MWCIEKGDSKISLLSRRHQETKIMLHNQSSILVVRYADVRSWRSFSFFLFIFSTAFFKCAFGFSTTPSTQDREQVLFHKPNNGTVSFAPSFLGNSDEGSRRRTLEIRFNGQAKHWTDALPIGNGRLGAMIWGGVPNEIINLNGKFCKLCSVFFCGIIKFFACDDIADLLIFSSG